MVLPVHNVGKEFVTASYVSPTLWTQRSAVLDRGQSALSIHESAAPRRPCTSSLRCERGGGFILLTGEVGTGKTTVNRCLLEQLPDTTDLAIILNPALSAVELLASACDELGIDYPKETHSLKALTDALHRYLLENYDRGRKTVLMIDEAQHLDFDVLEQIRLLTNLETNDEKLLQIILIGQPELSDKLARPELRQLNQRITARYNLQPLNLDETSAYIRHRLEVAGLKGDRRLFDSSAVKQIHTLTRVFRA